MIPTERWLYDYVPESGALAVDVGCFRGCWSAALAERFDRVIAIDVELDFLNELPDNVETMQLAVGDGSETTLERFPNRPHFINQQCAPSLKDSVGPREKLIVETTRLDNLVDKPVDFVKIDVEGAEIAALQGCKRIAVKDRARMIIECHSVELIAGVESMLHSWGRTTETLRSPLREEGSDAWKNYAHVVGK